MSDTNSFSATRVGKIMWRFAETTAFKRYGVKTSKKANIHVHNEHWLTSTRFSLFSALWTKVQHCSKPTHDHVASL